MAWCPNCDEIQDVAANAACPACAAPTLDAGRLRAPATKGNLAVIELAPEAPSVAPGEPAAFSIRAATSRRKLIAGLAVVVLAGGAVAGTRLGDHTSRPKAATPQPSAEPAVSSAPTPEPEPPLGSRHAGKIAIHADQGVTILNLATGSSRDVPSSQTENAWWQVVSRDGSSVAYRDDSELLWIAPESAPPYVLASDVTDYAFTEDGRSVIVLRSETAANGGTRKRIERRALDFSGNDLLFETSTFVSTFIWRRGTLLVVTGNEDGPSSLSQVTGRTRARHIGDGMQVLDVSADGEQALIRAEDSTPGLWILDLDTRKKSAVGPRTLFVTHAEFSPNGTAVAVVGTTNYETARPCGDCDLEYMISDYTLYRYIVSAKTLKKAFTGTELGAVAWGPADWVFVLNGGTLTAVPTDGPARSIPITTQGNANELTSIA